MITILHGENIVASRKELSRLKEEFKGEIVTLDSKTLTETDFIQATQSSSMFGENKLVVIEGMVKFELKNVTCEVLIWEGKKITPPKDVKNLEFKTPASIWHFLDTLAITDFRTALKDNDVNFVFLMLVRKYRLEAVTQKLKELLEIDYQYKQGLLPVDLETQIELFLIDGKCKR